MDWHFICMQTLILLFRNLFLCWARIVSGEPSSSIFLMAIVILYLVSGCVCVWIWARVCVCVCIWQKPFHGIDFSFSLSLTHCMWEYGNIFIQHQYIWRKSPLTIFYVEFVSKGNKYCCSVKHIWYLNRYTNENMMVGIHFNLHKWHFIPSKKKL